MKKLLPAILLLAISAFGCASTSTITATAVMEAKSGSEVSGTLTFTEFHEGTVEIEIDLTGVPEGVHGFHIHEKGDCSSADGKSAGGHFNPIGTAHAGPGDPGRHAGDLGNVTASPANRVRERLTMTSFSLSPGPLSAAGLAVILHEKRDDLSTQPTGAAGGRIGCGVITLTSTP